MSRFPFGFRKSVATHNPYCCIIVHFKTRCLIVPQGAALYRSPMSDSKVKKMLWRIRLTETLKLLALLPRQLQARDLIFNYENYFTGWCISVMCEDFEDEFRCYVVLCCKVMYGCEVRKGEGETVLAYSYCEALKDCQVSSSHPTDESISIGTYWGPK